MIYTLRFFQIVLLLFFASKVGWSASVRNYVFFDMERSRIQDRSFLETPALVGAQLKYSWSELEPAEGVYDFSAVRRDLAFLRSRRKKLFIQIQDVTFSPSICYVPNYLRTEARFHGGANKQYIIENNDEAHAKVDGWVARRWDPDVADRFHKLLFALGAQFDGRIEGINLPETAVEFGETGHLFPLGFTPSRYRDAILSNLRVLKRAFPKSATMIYANFMPGEWLPDDDKHFLTSVYACARELKVGVGGPDMLPYKPSQMHHSYPLIQASHGTIPTGIAVQEGDYEPKNPNTGKPMSIGELMRFATDYLKVDYIFWCTQEPYYSRALIPFLKAALIR